MDRKANPRLYDEIQDTESLGVVSTFSCNRAIFWLFENVQNSYHLPVAVSFLNNGLVWASIVVGRAFLIFFISGRRRIGMANNIKAYFFLSFFIITFILTRVIKQENLYSQVDFCKCQPVFLGVMLSSCRACHLNLTFSFCCCGSLRHFFSFFSVSKHPCKTSFFFFI